MEKARKLTVIEFHNQQENGGVDSDKFKGSIVIDDPVPEPKKTNVKWKLWLEYLEKGQSVRLPLSKEESRKHASTVRTLVSRFKKNNAPKNFAVRLVDTEEWTGIGIWRIEDR